MMRNLSRVLDIVQKNLLLLFRRWTSFVLLIIGPIILMVLIGYTFGGTSIENLTLGFVTQDDALFTSLQEDFGALDIVRFQTEQECTQQLRAGFVHMCGIFSAGFSTESQSVDSFSQGSVRIIVDNSQTIVSNTLVTYLQERFGLTSDAITLQAAQEFFGQVQQLVGFMRQGGSSLEEFEVMLSVMITELEVLQTDLKNASVNMDDAYVKLVDMQETINDPANDPAVIRAQLQETLDEVKGELDAAEVTLDALHEQATSAQSEAEETRADIENVLAVLDKQIVEQPEDVQQSYRDLALREKLLLYDSSVFADVTTQIEDSQETVDRVQTDIAVYEYQIDNTTSELPQLIDEYNAMVVQAGSMRSFFTTALNKTDESLVRLKSAQSDLQALLIELQNNTEQFSRISPRLAESLVTPFRLEHEPLMAGLTQVVKQFPVIFPIIVIFIATLFSNILVLGELYSKAQLRNFILPVPDGIILFAFYVTNMIVAMFQISILLLFAQLVLGVPLLLSIGSVLLVIFLLVTVFVLIGMIVAYWASTKENSILLATFLSIGFFLFSDVIIPSAIMPPGVSLFVNFNPLVLGRVILGRSILHGLPLTYSTFQIGLLIAYVIGLSVVLYIMAHRHRHSYQP